ncbi:hypothetical protein [Oceanicella sp. SM1341]|nr:hypothetical protein [Oceanicella sp. SM1341]
MRLDRTVSVGNLISIGTMIVVVTATYATMQARIGAVEDAGAERTRRVEQLADRMRLAEITAAGDRQKLDNILAAIGELKASIEARGR